MHRVHLVPTFRTVYQTSPSRHPPPFVGVSGFSWSLKPSSILPTGRKLTAQIWSHFSFGPFFVSLQRGAGSAGGGGGGRGGKSAAGGAGGGVAECNRRKSGRARKRKVLDGQAGDEDDLDDEYQSERASACRRFVFRRLVCRRLIWRRIGRLVGDLSRRAGRLGRRVSPRMVGHLIENLVRGIGRRLGLRLDLARRLGKRVCSEIGRKRDRRLDAGIAGDSVGGCCRRGQGSMSMICGQLTLCLVPVCWCCRLPRLRSFHAGSVSRRCGVCCPS